MGEDPGTIRREIEETRERMGDTAEALAHKANVPERARERVSGAVGGLKEKVTGVTEQVGGAAPDQGEVKQRSRRAVGVAQENPLGLALGALAVGVLVGMIVPTTRVEDERIGPMADQVKDQMKDTAQTAVEHGKQLAQETAQQASQTAKERGREHAGRVADEASSKAQETGDQVKSRRA
jgi:Protein of unknown function (DUF3618)